MTTIEVQWPDGGPLSETQWRRRLQDLAERAESLLAQGDATMPDRARLAVEWLGVSWAGLTPATIAASARGSLLVGENIVVAPLPADQIAERLAMLWQQADADPAAVVEVPMVMLERGPVPDHVPGTRRPKAKAKVEPSEVAVEAQLEPEQQQQLEPADLSHLTEAEFLSLAPQGFHGVGDEPAPAAATDWLTAHEAARLLNVSTATVHRWRLAGQLGQEGVDWHPHGRTFMHSRTAIDAVNTARAVPREPARRRRPTVGANQPPGWLRPDDVAQMLGVSGDSVRRMIVVGRIPGEMVVAAGPRSRWIDPAVLQFLGTKKTARPELPGGLSQEELPETPNDSVRSAILSLSDI